MTAPRKTYLTAEDRRRVAEMRPHYEHAQQLTGVPWLLLAAIHYRENRCRPSAPRPGGCMQKDPPWTQAQIQAYANELRVQLQNPERDARTSILMAAHFIQKEKARPRLSPSSPLAAQLDAAFRYNGTAYGSAAASPYVNNDPLNGRQMHVRGTLRNADGSVSHVSQPDRSPGVRIVMEELQAGGGGQANPLPTVPVVEAVYYPLQDWGRVRMDSDFLDPGYRRVRGVWHPGQDFNTAPGNGDLGEPMHAIAAGRVTFAGWVPIAGNTLVIRHEQFGVESVLMHCERMLVSAGQVVGAGDQVATMGRGDPAGGFTAHLHLEIREMNISPRAWPGGSDAARATILARYKNPLAWLRAHNARSIPRSVSAESLHPELIRIRSEMVAWLRVNRADLRLDTIRTYDPPLRPQLGPGGVPARLGPHQVRPALAFDYVLRRGAGGPALTYLDPVYTQLGNYAQVRGGLWGPNASPPPAGEGGGLRNHIQLRRAEEAIVQMQQAIVAGLVPNGALDGDAAGGGSDPEAEAERRRQNCPAPTP